MNPARFNSLITSRIPWVRVLIVLLFVSGLAACSPGFKEQGAASLSVDSAFLSISANASPSSTEEPLTETGNEPQNGGHEDDQFLVIQEIVIGLLFLAVLVGIAAHRLRVPYTIGLVLIGLLLTFRAQVAINISPNLILALLVPPLIYEAAFHLNFRELRASLAPILAMAVPGVILSTFLVAWIVSWGTGLSLPIALVFGSLVAATDPVSVVALFRSMGAPKRLLLLLEGESLFNDGTAIVIFNLVLAIAVAGVSSFNLVDSLLDFVRVAGGGLVVGILLGVMIAQMISRIDNHLLETTLTSVLAYGAYLVAEIMGVSGVLAVVAAGLVSGNIGPRGMSPTTRIVVFNFWEYAAFLANSFIFLLIGLQIELPVLFADLNLIIWAIAAVLIARAISVYGISLIERSVPFRWQHVLYWGGLRGAITLALALSLSDKLPEASNQIQVMAFGVVLFSLLIQGLTIKPLVTRLGLAARNETQEEYERRHARAVAAREAYEHLEQRNRQGLLSDPTWQTIQPYLAEYNRNLAEAVQTVMTSDPEFAAEELDTARREALRAQRSAISTLFKDGVISEENFTLLITEIDAALTRPKRGWPELVGQMRDQSLPVNRMIIAVIQERDVENALSALTKLSIPVTRLPSTGGFLGHRNATLLIGLVEGQEEIVVKALEHSSSQRVAYLASPVPDLPNSVGAPTAITVGGATVFVFKVDRFEFF